MTQIPNTDTSVGAGTDMLELRMQIESQTTALHLSTVKATYFKLAEGTTAEQRTRLQYLDSLLRSEQDARMARKVRRRISEAKFPIVKHLQEFRFQDNPAIDQAQVEQLAGCEWIDRAESVILVGGSGTGKTHLATALALSACGQGRSVRFTTLAHLANELAEAKDQNELGRIIARYQRIELIVLDELGYLALTETSAELVFQVITERNERGSLIITTNLPFSEWNKVFCDKRLTTAIVDRLTSKAHIIQTGNQSWRLKNAQTTT